MTLDEAARRIGSVVVYTPRVQCSKPYPCHCIEPGHMAEDGVITSVNDRFVFVRYRGDLSGSKATDPRDLELML